MDNHNKILRVFQLIGLLRSGPPRSLEHLSKNLGSTPRTVYRYLDLLKELGFVLRKDRRGNYFMEKSRDDKGVDFSGEELNFIQELVMTVGRKHKLSETVLDKINGRSDVIIGSELLSRAHIGKIIQELGRAIQERKQVMIKNYHSANSNNISNRIVEPVKFTPNMDRILCYEPISGQNKFFNVDRMAEVKLTSKKFRHESEHKYTQPDVFGFSNNGAVYPVDLKMSLRAGLLLRDEYPMAATFLKPVKDSGLYHFKADVFDLRPVTRFIMGLLPEMEEIGGQELREELRKTVGKLIGN